jgi:hypothetical protein
MALPGPARQLVKLFPIAFVPCGHLLFVARYYRSSTSLPLMLYTSCLNRWMHVSHFGFLPPV